MKRLTIGLVLAGFAAGVTVDVLQAAGQLFFWHQRPKPANFLSTNPSFKRVATLGNYLNNGADAGEETVSEIIAATANGNTLVYTDAVRGTIGFINITNPSSPLPLGTLVLDPNLADDIEHSPTSVDVLGNQYALVAVDTTTGEFDTPSGYLRVVDVSNPAAPFFVGGPIDLGGQPDSVKISPDESFVAIAIENQRNEDLCVGGTDDGIEADEEDCIAGGGAVGVLPQAPAGFLVVIALTGPPAGWVRQDVNLQGLASYAPEDPEPEFVDINQNNEAVVTLQENNHDCHRRPADAHGNRSLQRGCGHADRYRCYGRRRHFADRKPVASPTGARRGDVGVGARRIPNYHRERGRPLWWEPRLLHLQAQRQRGLRQSE